MPGMPVITMVLLLMVSMLLLPTDSGSYSASLPQNHSI